LRADHELVGFVDLNGKVLSISKQLLEVNDLLVEEHTCDSWSELITEFTLDNTIDTVTNEVALVLSLELVKLSHVDLRKSEELHSWLLTLWGWLSNLGIWHSHLLLRLVTELLLILTVLVWILVVSTSMAYTVSTSVATSIVTSVTSSVVVLVVSSSMATIIHLVSLVSSSLHVVLVLRLHHSVLLSSAEVDHLMQIVLVHIILLFFQVIL